MGKNSNPLLHTYLIKIGELSIKKRNLIYAFKCAKMVKRKKILYNDVTDDNRFYGMKKIFLKLYLISPDVTFDEVQKELRSICKLKGTNILLDRLFEFKQIKNYIIYIDSIFKNNDFEIFLKNKYPKEYKIYREIKEKIIHIDANKQEDIIFELEYV
jgi:hypothetical protein